MDCQKTTASYYSSSIGMTEFTEFLQKGQHNLEHDYDVVRRNNNGEKVRSRLVIFDDSG